MVSIGLWVSLITLAGCNQDGLQYVPPPDLASLLDLSSTQPPAADLPFISPPAITVKLAGTHRDCSTTWNFSLNGTFTRTDERNNCRSTGRFMLRPGDALDLVHDGTTCNQKPADLADAKVLQPKADLTILVHPSFGNGTASFWSDNVPHQRWKLVGGPTSQGGPQGTQIVRFIGDPQSGIKSACYWSGDYQCNGIFSCSGSLTQWSVTNGNLLAGLSCSGQCTCGTSIVGPVTNNGTHLDGKFFGQNCMLVYQGTLAGDAIADD